jgi:Lar family restriction alleviation protein
MHEPTILPCPFCGWHDVEIGEISPGEYAVDCPDCQCIGPFGETMTQAIEIWNRAGRIEQTETDPHQQELEL